MIFNKQGATIRKFKFYFQGQEIEIVKQYTYLEYAFIPSDNKHQGIENLINKVKESGFILQQFLYKSEGKTVNTYLTDTTIKPVLLYPCESWGALKDQNNLSKIEKFHLSLCKQILGIKNNTSSSKVLGKLGRFPFRITIETQFFKYLQRIPFVKKNCYLRKAFNEELELANRRINKYDNIRRKAFNDINEVDNIKLQIGNKVEKLKLFFAEGSLKTYNIFGQYLMTVFESG